MKFFYLLPLILCFFWTANADEDLAQLEPLSGRVFFVEDVINLGELADIRMELDLQEGFFAYYDKFFLEAVEPDDIRVGELNIEPLVEFEDNRKKKKLGIRNKGTITTQIEIPDGVDTSKPILLNLTYIACTNKFCLTPRTLDLSLQFQAGGSQVKTVNSSTSSYIQDMIEDSLLYALILTFFFGLLTSLTPCVYPLIPITLAVLGANKSKSLLASFLMSLTYVLGIAITYAILGVVAAQTGQLFGSLISHPAVVIAMSLIFFAMGLSLLGLFEIQAPGFIRNRMTNTQTQKGFIGAFISGLLAGVIASPCVGPVLVGILAYIAKTQNSQLGFILLFTFALGFGVLFIVLGTFSQLTNKLPRSGAWMNAVKTILALCLFGMSFYYSWPLIKKQFPDLASVTESSAPKPAWRAFSPDLVEQAKKDGKPVIIDFYADWCAACVEMDQFTFSKEEVIEKSKNFEMLKVDATSPFPELVEWQKTYKVHGLPTMILIDRNGEVREDYTLTGFEEAPEFLKRMDAVLAIPKK